MSVLENDNAVETAVMRALTYFDLFNYPLKSAEVFAFLEVEASKDSVERTLECLASQRQIVKFNDLYSLQPDPKIAERRQAGNSLADSLLPQITKQANVIFQFPFVRSVMASGSFSKNFMDEKSDFDFFIVCAPNRIWISRMLLVLFKKIFLKNSHKYFCVNYFVDEDHLLIDEKNIFTATELATALPLAGVASYHNLISSNIHWLREYFPNFEKRSSKPEATFPSTTKRIFEFAFTILFATYVNKLFRWITLGNWKRRYASLYPTSEFKIAFKSTNGVSKNHPRNYQKKIIEQYEARVSSLPNKIEVA